MFCLCFSATEAVTVVPSKWWYLLDLRLMVAVTVQFLSSQHPLQVHLRLNATTSHTPAKSTTVRRRQTGSSSGGSKGPSEPVRLVAEDS